MPVHGLHTNEAGQAFYSCLRFTISCYGCSSVRESFNSFLKIHTCSVPFIVSLYSLVLFSPSFICFGDIDSPLPHMTPKATLNIALAFNTRQ